ncbi:hypothetical protein SEA_OHMYWARD_61 [Gordonia phage OhMyWard]|uniref:Uncharacterized protein n=1 Tax=Gordonia phage OhMyWard TaxID=2652414 RepID=A0A5P8D7D6_9CAUD|nr:hypothetical protein HWC72_gp61 [Gordonia phage OhMyWard]QFP94943.1 hypothetical protein SEA_OHMYWARD_61 [Gordonia phage OhMyWard]WNM72444.1 hypothetical protein SEA_MOSSY_65 [Gordonia phage Mossy]
MGSKAGERAMRIPSPPTPMTPAVLQSYLQAMRNKEYIDVGLKEEMPVIVNGEPVVNAKVVNGKVVLQTYKDMLNENPPCKHHRPVQHRDGKPPWCYLCRLTADWENPDDGKARSSRR